jgi:serine kinase of HPr protein (carbohydrate metabolism regulator)
VADDRVAVFVSGGRLHGAAPAPLAGLLEIRGLGVVSRRDRGGSGVAVVRCVDAPSAVERLPDPRFETILGVNVPVFDLWPRNPPRPRKSDACWSILESLSNERIKAARAAPPGRHGLWGSRLRNQA